MRIQNVKMVHLWQITGFLAVTLFAVGLPAAEQPDISKLSVAELNKAQPPPAGLFAAPFSPQRPSPASMIWGGQFAWWNDGTFYLVYDTFGQNKLPYYLITSKDGVYWKEQGAYFDTDSDIDPEKFGVINPEVYKLGKAGPFCMAYTTCGQIRFATSFDMKEWTRYGKEPVIKSEETTYYKQWLTPASYPHPDGGWAHYVYAQSKEYIGMGYARSKDGIHFEPLPPVKFIGVPEDRFNDQVEWGKGCELAGITKLGNKYVMLGGSRQGDIFLLADRLEGPFYPPAKNDTLPRDPDNFWRIYNDVPDAPLLNSSTWTKDGQGHRAWYMMPLKRLCMEEGSVWIKYWQPNDLLKAHPVYFKLNEEGSFKTISQTLDIKRVSVIECKIDFSAVIPSVDLADHAKVSASQTYTFGPASKSEGAEDYLAVRYINDNKDERSWIGDCLGISHFGQMGLEKYKKYLDSRSSPSIATFDLGGVKPLGSIYTRWTRCPGPLPNPVLQPRFIEATTLSVSKDGTNWTSVQPAFRDDLRLIYENINQEARYIKYELPPLNHIPSNQLKGDIELRSYKVSGLAEVDVYAETFFDVNGALPAVVFEGTGEFNECVLFDPRGRVHFGELKKGTSNFIHRSTRNIDRPFRSQAQLRMILTDDVYEIYVDDYFIRFMEARHPVTGKVSFSRNGKNFINIKAWTARASAEKD